MEIKDEHFPYTKVHELREGDTCLRGRERLKLGHPVIHVRRCRRRNPERDVIRPELSGELYGY